MKMVIEEPVYTSYYEEFEKPNKDGTMDRFTLFTATLVGKVNGQIISNKIEIGKSVKNVYKLVNEEKVKKDLYEHYNKSKEYELMYGKNREK